MKGVTSMTFVTDSELSAAVTDGSALVTGIRMTSAILASRPGLNRVTNPPATMSPWTWFRRTKSAAPGDDLVGLSFKVMIGIFQQAETFIGHGNFGGQHLLQAFEVRAIGGRR
jgi:hypothetical protein